MNMLTKTAFGVAMSSAMALPVLAGGYSEPVTEAPVIAPVVAQAQPNGDWNGAYVGMNLGYGDISSDATDGDGAMYGVRGGYDWDLGQWVVGVNGSWDKTEIDLGSGGDEVDNIARFGGRVGYDFGQTLLYGTAGIARAEATIANVDYSDNGWYAGIGADYMLNDRWSIGAEVLHNQFDDFDNSGQDIDGTTAALTVGLRF